MERFISRLLTIIFLVLFSNLLFAGHSSAQEPISFGQTITASISTVGESDIYAFEANAGDIVQVSMTSTSSMDPEFGLFGPDGSLVVSYGCDGPCEAIGRKIKCRN
jgi:hypothetical protein